MQAVRQLNPFLKKSKSLGSVCGKASDVLGGFLAMVEVINLDGRKFLLAGVSQPTVSTVHNSDFARLLDV